MASLTFATIKIATKEDVNNVFIFSFLKKLAAEKPYRFENIILSKNREYVIVNYIPALDFDIYDLVEELSKETSYTLSTIGHSYGNMQLTTVEYIVVYKNGEVVFEGDYPLVVFDDNGEMDDDGGYPIDEEATKTVRNKLEADKKEWFPIFYQELEELNSNEEDVVWQPSSEEIAEEPSEKLTEKKNACYSLCLNIYGLFALLMWMEQKMKNLVKRSLKQRLLKKSRLFRISFWGRIILTMTQKKKKKLNKLYEKLSVKDKKELQKLVIFGKKIEEEVKK